MASVTDERLRLYDNLDRARRSLADYDASKVRIVAAFGEYAFTEQRRACVRAVTKAADRLNAFNAANPPASR